MKDMKKKDLSNERMKKFYIFMNVWSKMMKWMKTLRQVCVMFVIIFLFISSLSVYNQNDYNTV